MCVIHAHIVLLTQHLVTCEVESRYILYNIIIYIYNSNILVLFIIFPTGKSTICLKVSIQIFGHETSFDDVTSFKINEITSR